MALPLVKFIQELGADVCHLQDEFDPGVKDIEWIPWVGKQKYIAVTCDERLRKNAAERDAIMKHKVAVLLLPNRFTMLPAWDQAAWLIPHWRRIDKEARLIVKPGNFYKVTDNGKVEPMK